jgi:glycine cleavage system transcriptional repressor
MADRTFLTMAALGADHPGLVRLISRYVFARGGNVEDSRMVSLGGVFGLLLLVSAPPDGAARIVADAEALESEAGLRVMIESAREPKYRSDGKGALWTVRASAVDREGLLADLAEAVRAAGGDIVELDSTTTPAPQQSGPVFQLRMTVIMRTAGDLRRMKDALMALAIEERIELDIKAAERTETKAAGLTLLP